jgi:lipid-A-disaccharide synthase
MTCEWSKQFNHPSIQHPKFTIQPIHNSKFRLTFAAMKYFIVAGEASGDLHGANLIKAIKLKDTQAEFQFWGGDLMQAQANGLLMHYKQTSIMGFVEVLLKIRTILGFIATCKRQILAFKPDVVILIDYPGFNLRIAAFAKHHGIKTVYYIAPKVWAWKENRAKKLEKFVDELLIIFPFEIAYFKKWKVKTSYIGNPLLDEINNFTADDHFKEKNNISADKPIIALLPGSRKQEISATLPNMMKLADAYPQFEFIICAAPAIKPDFYTPFLSANTKIIYNKTYEVLHLAKAAIVCSGTATLETALFNVPQVCAYVANNVSYFIAKQFVKIKYISLVNLNLNKAAITELIQDDYTLENLKNEFEAILPNGKKHQVLMNDYLTLTKELNKLGASNNAAQIITDLITKK